MDKKTKGAGSGFCKGEDDAFRIADLSVDDTASAPRRSSFLDIFSEVHSAPEDLDSVKFSYGNMGRSEDRRQIRKYFARVISDARAGRARAR